MHTGYNIKFPQFSALISLFELYGMWNIRTKAATTATAKTIKTYSRQKNKQNKMKIEAKRKEMKKELVSDKREINGSNEIESGKRISKKSKGRF